MSYRLDRGWSRPGAHVGWALGAAFAAVIVSAGFATPRAQARQQPPAAEASGPGEKPIPIDRRDLPKKAPCVVCTARGTMLGDLKVAAGVTYRGKPYYFCIKEEVAEFSKDPESFLPRPIPRPAPAFTLKNVSGEPVTLAELSKGRVLLVDFWATWCGPCVKAMPGLQKLHEKYGAGSRFSVVGVSTDEEGLKKVSPFLSKSKTKFTYPILLDAGGEKGVWKQWGVVALPAMFLVKDGQVVAQWTGNIDHKKVEAAVAQAVTGAAPAEK